MKWIDYYILIFIYFDGFFKKIFFELYSYIILYYFFNFSKIVSDENKDIYKISKIR